MISLARMVMRRLAVRVSAVQLIAPLMVALLILSPFTPLAPVMIVPAKADKVQDCLNSIAAAANLAETLAQDLPGLTECGGKVASGDVVMAAIAVIIAGFAAGNGGSFGAGDQVAACEGQLNDKLLGLITTGLNTFFDAGTASDTASKGVGSVLANLPGADAVLSEAQCGCKIVAGAIDVAKATADLANDAKACGEILFDYAAAAGKAIGGEFYAVGDYLECKGLLGQGACSAGDGTRENIAYEQCGAGAQTISSTTTHYVDEVHGDVTVVSYGISCSCPAGTHERLLDGWRPDIAKHAACTCDDKGLAYDGTSCKACDGYVKGDGTCEVCSTTVAGLVAFGNNDRKECHVKPLCASPQAYDAATNSCVTCQANFFADHKPSLNAGDDTNPGQCSECKFGQRADAGAASCTWLNCSLIQQVNDNDGGHSCIPCLGSIEHRLDADVCLDSQGNAMQLPQTCAWGDNLTLADGTTSPAAYNPDDCKPVSCKGTDHIDLGGHECMKCQNIMNIPLALLGGGGGSGGGLQVIPMDGGKATVSGSNGKTYTVSHVEKDGAKYAAVTAPDGKVQTTKGGGKGPMLQVCLDPPVTQPIPVTPKIPPLQVMQEKPQLQYQEYTPRPAYPGNLFGNSSPGPGTDPGNFPDKSSLGKAMQDGATSTGTPMAMPGRPVPPPPPGGGTGHTDPAAGDNKSAPTSTGPARTKGKDNPTYTTVTVPVEPDTPTSTGPGRTKGKDDGKTSGAPDGGYKSFTLKGKDADTSAPTSTGPGRNSRGKDKGSFTSHTDPAKGEGTNGNTYKYDKDDPSLKSHDPGSSNGTPQPHPTPGLNNGPELRATPRLNDGPEMRMTPRLNDSPTLRAAPSLNDGPGLRATPRLNDGPQLRTTPSLNNTPRATIQASPPPTTRAPPPSGNTAQPERIRPMLNDSRSGPTLNSGTGAPSNPFAR